MDIKEQNLLNMNRYATKNTLSQGLIDMALLTANATQLNFILKVGEDHAFYTFLLVSISASIFVQLLQVIVCTILGSCLNVNEEKDHDNANMANDFILYTNGLLIVINAFISAFEMKEEYAFRRNVATENVTRIIPNLNVSKP